MITDESGRDYTIYNVTVIGGVPHMIALNQRQLVFSIGPLIDEHVYCAPVIKLLCFLCL